MDPAAHAFTFHRGLTLPMQIMLDLRPLYQTYPWLILTPGLLPWAIWALPVPDSVE